MKLQPIILALCLAASAFAQTALLNGTVTDPSGAAVPGASISVSNTENGQLVQTNTNEKGDYSFPSMPAGNYRVTVTKEGFKAGVKENVNMQAGVPATVNVKLEVGAATETVVVQGGAELVQTTSATVSSTITGRQINELPTATRNGMESFINLPGTQTTSSFRSTYVNGLPLESINVTIDGVGTNDQWLKSQDGFFSYIMPSVDSLEEVTLSTAAGGVDATAQGGAQLKFVTRGGTNQFHGGVFWQHRNTFLNANYYFNNINGLPRDIIKLNQFGGHIGGPIKKDKLLFFLNFEERKLPSSATFSRTVLPPTGFNGDFTYKESNGTVNTVNLFQLAAAANTRLASGVRAYPTAPDPIIAKTLNQIWGFASTGTLKNLISSSNDYNRLTYSEQPTSTDSRGFWTGRVDYNLTQKQHLTLTMNYDVYTAVPDLLNSVYPVFPGTGTVLGSTINAGQRSRRFEGTAAWRSTISPRITNELRFGLTGGTVLFADGAASPALYSEWKGFSPGLGYVSGVSTATSNSRRNAPVKDVAETLSWVKGAHQFSFGGTFTQVNTWQQSVGSETLPSISFGMATGDPATTGANAWLTNINLPGITSSDLSSAGSMYAMLTGRVSSIGSQVVQDETTHKYAHNPAIDRNVMKEYGGFVQDTWRISPGLTATIGARLEYQAPFENLNGTYSYVGLDGIYGVSGIGNLFKPGTLTGVAPTYKALNGRDAYSSPAQVLPSVGVAYQLPAGEGFLRFLTGRHPGAAVIRGGYSISSTRPGGYNFQSIWGSNKGLYYSTSVDPSNFPQYFGSPGSVYFADATLPSQPAPAAPAFPLSPAFNDSLNDFDPHLKMGYVQSWNIGYQRELNRDTVVEFRYTGNHGLNEWRQINLNEVNIYENGFINEEIVAQNNLAIANGVSPAQLPFIATLKSNNFGNQGLPGQQNLKILPVTLGTACCTDTTTATNLAHDSFGSVANSQATNLTRLNNLIAAGYPSNFWQVNPAVGSGGTWLMTNWGSSMYDAGQVEVRRRMAHGLQMQASYVFGKSLINGASSSSADASQPTTLRNLRLNRTTPSYDIRHAIKANWIYEFPFGPGQSLLSGVHSRFVKKAIEGWELTGTTRIQAGQPSTLTSGRGLINGNEGGVVLHNITLKQLQDQIGVYKTTGSNGIGIVYDLPIDIIHNTEAAFNNGGFVLDPNAPYIGPQTAPGQLAYFDQLRGPWQKHLDVSLLKRTRIREQANVEFRAQALNVLNITNFYLGSVSASSTGFGQVTSAFRDTSNATDPGGRILEFVVRINF
ncbi:MAG TPA: carboxypeptidase regulatory-like domain-containing protein [Candidatus Limnocylindrales bacterium]|nr:carboxypeptidase regulatory-like domain-containing protein [Candidatus Limnocylindrales bacterium]